MEKQYLSKYTNGGRRMVKVGMCVYTLIFCVILGYFPIPSCAVLCICPYGVDIMISFSRVWWHELMCIQISMDNLGINYDQYFDKPDQTENMENVLDALLAGVNAVFMGLLTDT